MKAARAHQRGFALLLVFLMAAAVALLLYKAMPRAAFETERDKEQLLIDRGNQYKRAIQLYYMQYRRYPSSIDDLESTNNKRYLRRRYANPFTGKDDWRIIHTNGMFLTDSKVQAPPVQAANGQPGAPGTGTTGGVPGAPTSLVSSSSTTQIPATQISTGPVGTNPSTGAPNSPPQVNATVLARPSDRTLPNAQTFPANNAPGGNLPPITYTGTNQNQNFNANDPNGLPPITLFPNGYNAPAQGPATQPNQPGANRPLANPANPNGLPSPGLNIGGDGLPPITLGNGTNQLQPLPNQPGVNPPPIYNQPGAPSSYNPFNQPQLPNAAGNQNGFTPGGVNPPGFNPPTQPVGLPGANLGNLPQNLAQQGLINSPQNPAPPPSNIFPDPGLNQPQQPGFAPFPQNNPPRNVPNVQQQNPGNFNPGAPQPGAGPAGQSALQIINGLLTTARPPPPGIGPTSPAQPGQSLGGGIAGIASSFAGPSIKTYAGQDDFSKWEFVFTLQQQTGVPGVPNPNANAATGGGATPGIAPITPMPGLTTPATR